jgi:hypothetical protein
MLDKCRQDARGPTHGVSRIGCACGGACYRGEAGLALLPPMFFGHVAAERHGSEQLAPGIDHGRGIPGD